MSNGYWMWTWIGSDGEATPKRPWWLVPSLAIRAVIRAFRELRRTPRLRKWAVEELVKAGAQADSWALTRTAEDIVEFVLHGNKP